MPPIFLRRPQQHGHAVKSETFACETEYPASNFHTFPAFAGRREDENLIIARPVWPEWCSP